LQRFNQPLALQLQVSILDDSARILPSSSQLPVDPRLQGGSMAKQDAFSSVRITSCRSFAPISRDAIELGEALPHEVVVPFQSFEAFAPTEEHGWTKATVAVFHEDTSILRVYSIAPPAKKPWSRSRGKLDATVAFVRFAVSKAIDRANQEAAKEAKKGGNISFKDNPSHERGSLGGDPPAAPRAPLVAVVRPQSNILGVLMRLALNGECISLQPVARKIDADSLMPSSALSGAASRPKGSTIPVCMRWGMPAMDSNRWERAAKAGMLPQLGALALILDAPAIRTPVIRSAVLFAVGQWGGDGQGGWAA